MIARPSRNLWTIPCIIALTLAQFAGAVMLLTPYAFAESNAGLRFFAVGVDAYVLLTLAGLWFRTPWALWATLTVASLNATIGLFAWATDHRGMASVSEAIAALIVVLVFVSHVDSTPYVSRYLRVLFSFVLCFAAWVAFWGLLLPARVTSALPFQVPPLHSRFLGVMYLSGCVFMLLGMKSCSWSEVRVTTAMLAIWTGLLGLISLFRFAAFDWSRTQTWFWFFAYICFPLVALWVAWFQRNENDAMPGRPLSKRLRIYLFAQGALAMLLGLCLLFAPRAMTALWPWPIRVLLAQLYSAPFLSYGIGSLYAARQRRWIEVRSAIVGTLAFALGVLAVSLVHVKLFDAHALPTWLWFGGFGVASVALGLFSAALLWESTMNPNQTRAAP